VVEASETLRAALRAHVEQARRATGRAAADALQHETT
jgi:hypothetical protein